MFTIFEKQDTLPNGSRGLSLSLDKGVFGTLRQVLKSGVNMLKLASLCLECLGCRVVKMKFLSKCAK